MNAIMNRQLITKIINEWFNQQQLLTFVIYTLYIIINIYKQGTMKKSPPQEQQDFLHGNVVTGNKTTKAFH